jgi:hypothetical protein
MQVYGFSCTDVSTGTTLPVFKIKAIFIDIGDQGNGLGVVNMDGLIHGYVLIEWIRVLDRAVLGACGTARTLILYNVPWFFNQVYPKVPCAAPDTLYFRITQDLDVGMPADLDQFG